MSYLKKELYQLIQEDEAIFDFIQSATFDGLWVWDLDDRENLWLHEKFWQTLGYNAAEMSAEFTTWQKVIHPEDLEQVLLNLSIYLKNPNNSTYQQIIRYRHASGHMVWMRSSGKALQDASGEYTRMFGVQVNVSDSKLYELEKLPSERALRKSEEKHRRLFETMSTGVVYQDIDGQIISANPAAEEILGLSLKQLLGVTSIDPRWKMLDENGKEITGENHPAMVALRTGKPIGPVTRAVFQPAKDRYVWLSISAIPLFESGAEKPYQVYATFDDITLQKQAQIEIRNSKDQFESLVNNIPGVTYRCKNDTKWTMIFLSRSIDNVSGYAAAELLNDAKVSYGDIIDPNDLPQVRALMTKALDAKEFWEIEYRIRHKDGSLKWVFEKGRAIFDEEGNILYLDGFILDITERKQQQEALLFSNQRANYKSELLEAVAQSILLLTQEENWLEALQKSLPLLGAAMQVDRTYFFQNSPYNDISEIFTSQKLEWVKGGISAQIDNPNLQNVPFLGVFGYMGIQLMNEKVFEAIVSEIPPGETKELLDSQDILTIIEFPVTVEGVFFGFIGFDDCTRERKVTPDERNIMKSFAESLSRTILLQKQKQAIIDAKQTAIYKSQLLEAVNKANQVLLSGADWLSSLKENLMYIGKALNADRALYYHRHSDDTGAIYTSQLLEWVGEGIKPGINNPMLQNLPVTDMFGEIVDSFYENRRFEAITTYLPEGLLKSLLQSGDVKTAILFPIFIDDQLFGAIAFDDCTTEREFTPDEINILDSFINSLRGAIQLQGKQQDLVTSEAKLRNILDSTSDLIFLISPEGKIINFNLAAANTMKKLNGKEVKLGDAITDFAFEGTEEAFLKDFKTALKGVKVVTEQELRLENIGNWFEFLYFPVYDASGDIIGVSFNCINRDQKKEAERALKESEAYYRSLIKAIPDLMFVINSAGEYIAYEAANEELHVTPEHILGNKITETLPSNVAQKLMAAAKQALRKNKLVELQYSLEIKKKTRYFAARVVAFGEDKVIVVATNVTESVHNLQRIESLLETKEAQNERLNGFNHIVSHNLRSHVANMEGLMSILAMESPEIYDNQFVAMLRDASKNLHETINHLDVVLDINNIGEDSWEVIDLHQLVNSTINSVGQLARNAAVDIQNRIPEQYHIKTIPAYMQSIVLNFLTNGIKYKAEREDSFVEVRLEHDQDGYYHIIVFTDNGMGIDLNIHRKNLFGMYKTFHTHKESKGLGLFITKNQIDAMEGLIKVESEVNNGTTFQVYLPKID